MGVGATLSESADRALWGCEGTRDVSVGLDSLTGDATWLSRSATLPREEMQAAITSSEARSIGEQAGAGTAIKVVGPMFMGLTPTRRWSERGEALRAQNKSVLAYLVTGSNLAVVVAADTGEVLSSWSSLTGSAEQYAERLRRGSVEIGRDRPWPAVAGVAAVGVLDVWRRRRAAGRP